jgi:hypothetical protein
MPEEKRNAGNLENDLDLPVLTRMVVSISRRVYMVFQDNTNPPCISNQTRPSLRSIDVSPHGLSGYNDDVFPRRDSSITGLSDINAAKYRSHFYEPSLCSVLAQQPDFDF